MLAHWFTAQAVKAWAQPIIIALEVQQVFIKTWTDVRWPSR